MAGKDVNITIGAQNQASAILEKVGKDSRQLGQRVQQMSRETVSATKTAATGFEALKTAAGPLIAAFAAFKAATAGFSFLSDSSAAFDTQQEAVRGLTQAIEQSGDVIGPTIEEHKAFASALQASINVGDEVTLGLEKQASILGVSNDQLQGVTKAAIGLSEVTGQGLNESLKKVLAATNGNAASLAEMIPALRSATTEEERLAIINEVAAKGLEQMSARAGDASGSATRLSNSWGDFKEVVGELLAPLRMVINSGLAVLVETIQSAVIPAMQSIMPSAETIKNAMEQMRVGIVSAVTFAEVVITNFGSVWDLLKTSVELQVTSIVESVKHAFTVTIPAYASWFGDNFTNMIRDVFAMAATTVANYIQNMADIILTLWDFVRSGFEGGAEKLFTDVGAIAGRNLLEGFEASTAALPEIAARQLTESERALSARISGIAGNLGDQYAEKLAERLGVAGNTDSLAVSLLAGAGANSLASALGGKSGGGFDGLKSSESRLLTRGPGTRLSVEELLTQILTYTKQTAGASTTTAASQAEIESAARETQRALEEKGSVMFASPPV